MKVKYISGTGEHIKGELTSSRDRAYFTPDLEPYGPYRLRIEEPTYVIGGKDDDNCIWISGYVQESQGLWREVERMFYPILS